MTSSKDLPDQQTDKQINRYFPDGSECLLCPDTDSLLSDDDDDGVGKSKCRVQAILGLLQIWGADRGELPPVIFLVVIARRAWE